ncbi:hypothetical protein HYPSUDRAFT_278812 [Hypholoma sublateritium FD-334 SS-4]|uniref:F-box domain-containing protein n=1 Tax=Hypholoma sublateritium (strain FD-334 SS-4) TaxID=945553 RepID=A0A0D2Q4Q2_HYPSF|nr:hypothetical protein HYPSUDRAFT_278812 [Hypholoma sublateritium FD-334 SS-4]
MYMTQTCLRLPHIPTEVIHEIIDKVPSGDSGFLSTRSNVALVSRCCRHRINFHRFSELEIYIHSMPFDRLKTLAGLLDSNTWRQQEGIAQHIKSVFLKLGQRSPGTPLYIQSRDSIIADILTNLFKGSGSGSSDGTPYSLSIGTSTSFSHYHKNGPHPMTGLAFDTLGAETISILHVLSRNRHLTTLRLEAMWNVPSSIFSALSILNLYINHVQFAATESLDNSPLLPNLVYLDAKEAHTFVPTCYGPRNEHARAIRKVRFWLRDEQEYPGLFIIGKYATTLEIVLHKILDIPRASVDYVQSSTLKHLRVLMEYDQYIVSDPTNDEVIPEMPHQLYFLNMLHLLPSDPPPVLDFEIKVCLLYYHYPATVCEGIYNFYSQVYHPSLVRWLERRCSSTGTQATLTFDIYFNLRLNIDYDPNIFQEECEPYLHNLLSAFNGLDGVKLDLRVSGG